MIEISAPLASSHGNETRDDMGASMGDGSALIISSINSGNANNIAPRLPSTCGLCFPLALRVGQAIGKQFGG
jgi:hypothetical protein